MKLKGPTSTADPEDGKNYAQVLSIFAATLVTFTMGVQFTWTSPTIPILISTVNKTSDEIITIEAASYLLIIPSISLAVASPIVSYLMDICGRKKILLFSTIPHLITWTLIAYGGNIYVYYAARFANGVADACCFTAVSVYIAEVTTPAVRSTWGNAITFVAYLGNFMMNLVGVSCSIRNTAFIFMSVPVLFLLVVWYLPETPYFYLMRNRKEDALKALRLLRRKTDVDAEFTQLQKDVQRQQSEAGGYLDIWTIPSNRKALSIAILLRWGQQFCGISAIGVYTQYIFEDFESSLTAVQSTLLMSGLLLFFNFMASFTLNMIGRRMSMVWSSLGAGIILMMLSAYFYIDYYDIVDTKPIQWIPIAIFILFIPFYSIGLGILPTVMAGELFSSSIKGKAMCLINISFGIFLSFATKIFQVLQTEVALFAPFVFFSICSLLCAIASYFCVPETTGKTLEEIQQDFKNSSSKKKNKNNGLA